ncbi:MAG: hypothetical protein WC858_01575 [Parcubacteria group bacterium]
MENICLKKEEIVGQLFFLNPKQAILAFNIIYRDGSYDCIAINVGPFYSKETLNAWTIEFLEGILEASLAYPNIDDCQPSSVIDDDLDLINDEFIEPGDPRRIAKRYLAVTLSLSTNGRIAALIKRIMMDDE